VEIRPAVPEDAEAVTSLLGQLGHPADRPRVERRLERLFRDPDESLFVAQADGRVVGVARLQVSPALEYDADVGKLAALVVDEGYRGRGIGRALVDAVEKEAHARRCALLFLTSAERRADAHAFYTRLGFEETGRRFAKTFAPN
jgi:GNAT superfamily N-acetyltransferase